MTELFPAAAAYLDALPEARHAEASADVRDGKSDVAVSKLRMADPELSRVLSYQAVEVLAGRLGATVRCMKCFTPRGFTPRLQGTATPTRTARCATGVPR